MEETEKKQIPEMNFSDNKVILATIEVPLVVNGEEIKVTMQKLPIGDKQNIIKKCAATKIVGQQVTGNVDPVEYQISLLAKVIIKAPFPSDEAFIRTIDEKIVEYLYEEYDKFASSKKKV